MFFSKSFYYCWYFATIFLLFFISLCYYIKDKSHNGIKNMSYIKNKKKIYRFNKKFLKRNYKTKKHNAKLEYKFEYNKNKAYKKDYKLYIKKLKKMYKINKKDAKNTYKIEKQKYKEEIFVEKSDIKYQKHEKNKILNEAPKLSTLEEVGNAVSHGIGSALSITMMVLMLIKSNTALKVIASVVYGLSLIFMFLMSCLYHSYKWGKTIKRIWRRFDYSSIYLLIGGTFAPLFLVYLGNTLGIVMAIIQWLLIIFGITIVSIFGPGRFKWIHFTLYFIIGWSGVVFIPSFIKNNIGLLYSILGGGIVYTVGMIPFTKRGKAGAHFIWHIFVLLGAVIQWLGIYLIVY